MKILGCDTETTGLDPKKDRITEIGLVLYDSAAAAPVRISGFLVQTGAIVTEEITQLTGITQEAIAEYGVPAAHAIAAVVQMASKADFMCAHNAPFDKSFLDAEFARQGKSVLTLPWIDTRTDLPKAAYQLGKSASLRYLCADHGFLYSAHRAVNDVLAMLELLSRYKLDKVIQRAQTPNVNVRAVVSFDDRILAKERGYYWKPELKLWVKPLKADEVEEEKLKAPFPVVQMQM